MAKAAKHMGKDKLRFYTLLGDGECDEGEVREAFLFTSHDKLDNLCVIIDLNGLQIDGTTKSVMNISPLDAKLKDFGFNVVSINGYDFDAMEPAFASFHACNGKPTAS